MKDLSLIKERNWLF